MNARTAAAPADLRRHASSVPHRPAVSPAVRPGGTAPPAARRGFTLVELLVALFITAIIFAIGYGAIDQALAHRDTLQEHEDRLTHVQVAVQVLVQDFAQVSARPVRDSLGTAWLPCLFAQAATSSASTDSSSASATTPGATSSSAATDDSGVDLVIFTRAGWANPAGIQRPTLERVSYRLVDGRLRRMHWAVLDATEATLPLHRDLLDHVHAVGFRFMDDSRQWIDQWPPTGNSGMRTRPLAVEVTLDLSDWGKIVRVIEIPA